MDPTKRALAERSNTRGLLKKAAAQLDLNNPPRLTNPTSPCSPENGNGNGNGIGNGNHVPGQMGSPSRGGEANRGRARSQGQQFQTRGEEREGCGNQMATHSAKDNAEESPSTPSWRPALGAGPSPCPASGLSASREMFARPRDYFEGVKSLLFRLQLELPSESLGSSARTIMLEKSRSQFLSESRSILTNKSRGSRSYSPI